MKIRNTFLLLTPFVLILFSCTENRLDVELENEPVDLKFYYVDQVLYNSTKEELIKQHQTYADKLDDLYVYEWQQNLRSPHSDSLPEQIYNFYQTAYIHDLEQAKAKIVDVVKSSENQINKGFQYFNHHFIEAPVPHQVIFMNKLFSNIHCSDSALSVGLESYLSPQSEVVKSIPKNQLYEWQRDRMNIIFLPRDILLNWIQVHLFEEIDKKLAQHIVQAGKILYILNASFPHKKGNFILRYSQEDWEWAQQNEKLTWDYLVKEQLLFKNNRRDKANFLNAGPKTVGLPDDAPDRMGQFLGYKMVKGYMDEHKDVSLPTLIKMDYNKILQSYEIE